MLSSGENRDSRAELSTIVLKTLVLKSETCYVSFEGSAFSARHIQYSFKI